jgi:hypothetical protein
VEGTGAGERVERLFFLPWRFLSIAVGGWPTMQQQQQQLLEELLLLLLARRRAGL